MEKSTIKNFLFLMIIMGLANCSKSFNSQFVYIYGNQVKIMSQPRISAELLGLAEQYEMLEFTEEQTINKEKWFHVTSGKISGYIKEKNTNEEGVTAFYFSTPKEAGIVLTPSLNVYKKPSNTSETFTITRGDFFKIVLKDTSYKGWLAIQTSNKKIGFISDTNFLRGNEEYIDEIYKNKIETAKGWIKITAEKPTFKNIPGPNGRPIKGDDPTNCSHDLSLYPQKNGYVPVVDKVIINNITYYHFMKEYMYSGYCEGGINAWISEKEVMYIPDFFNHTINNQKSSIDNELLVFLNNQIGGDLNTNTIKIKEVALGSIIPDSKYYKIRCHKGVDEPYQFFLVAKIGKHFKILHLAKSEYLVEKEIHDNWDEYEDSYLAIRDIDGDNKFELIELDLYEAEIGLNVFSFKNGEYKIVLNFKIGGLRCLAFEDFQKLDLRHIVFFKNCYGSGDLKSEWLPKEQKLDYAPFDKKFEGNEVRVLEFKNGGYIEINSKNSNLDYNKLFEQSLPCTECPNTDDFVCK